MDNKFIKPGYKPNVFPCDYCKYGCLNTKEKHYEQCARDCNEWKIYNKKVCGKNEK